MGVCYFDLHAILKGISIYVLFQWGLKMSSSNSPEVGCTEKSWEDVRMIDIFLKLEWLYTVIFNVAYPLHSYQLNVKFSNFSHLFPKQIIVENINSHVANKVYFTVGETRNELLLLLH